MPANARDAAVDIKPTGALVIDRASTLKAEIAAALDSSADIVVDLSLVEELDLSCLQILYAARRAALKAGKQFHFAGKVQQRVAKRLVAVGILRGETVNAGDFEAALVDFQ